MEERARWLDAVALLACAVLLMVLAGYAWGILAFLLP